MVPAEMVSMAVWMKVVVFRWSSMLLLLSRCSRGALLRSCLSEKGLRTVEHALGTVVMCGMGKWSACHPKLACVLKQVSMSSPKRDTSVAVK